MLHSTNQEEGTVPPEQADLRVFDENRKGEKITASLKLRKGSASCRSHLAKWITGNMGLILRNSSNDNIITVQFVYTTNYLTV